MLQQPTASRVSRRAALRLFASAAGIALLAACQAPTPATPSTSAPAPKPTTPASAAQPTQPAASAQPTQAAAASPALANDRAAQAGFLPVGVAASSTAPLTAPNGQPRS